MPWQHIEEKLVIKKIKMLLRDWWKAEAIFVGTNRSIYSDISQMKNELWRFIMEHPELKKEVISGTSSQVNQCHIENSPYTTYNLESLGITLINIPLNINKQPIGHWIFFGFSTDTSVSKIKNKLHSLGASENIIERVETLAPSEDSLDMEKFLSLCMIIPKECTDIYNHLFQNTQNVDPELCDKFQIEHGLIGQGEAMQAIFQKLEKIVDHDHPVLIQGESGTGKELLAQAIQKMSARKDAPFICHNFSALNDNLIESAIFGHKKGSFTGATVDKKGLFEAANGGTLFLDEIGDISPSLQVKLLRVLQEGTFLPVGGNTPVKVDVRIIAATHKNLKKMMLEGKFREDLYYRLNVIDVKVPALRERSEDIPLLLNELTKPSPKNKFKKYILSEQALNLMTQFDWPGNIRQLQNEVAKLMVVAKPEIPIQEHALSEEIRSHSQKIKHLTDISENEDQFKFYIPKDFNLKSSLSAIEKQIIKKALIKFGSNRSELSKELGISRSGLIQKLKQYNLDQTNLFEDEKKKAS